jgi:PhnB protein
MSVKPIPEGYHTVTPYLIVQGAANAIEFYKKAFGATEIMRMPCGQTGRLMHAEVQIGDSRIMLADEMPEMKVVGPRTLGGTTIGICLYVPDVDATFGQAIAAGATQLYPIKNQFYGDRSGSLIDPFGHKWTIATHIEDVTPQEMVQRSEKAMKEFAAAAAT